MVTGPLAPAALQLAAAVPDKNMPVVLVCNVGGTLEEYGPSKYGRQSRSLMAAYELIQAGYKNVQVCIATFGV